MDLFVRVSNKIAISMYTQLGYIVYRTILEYYSGDPDEDAYGESIDFMYSLQKNLFATFDLPYVSGVLMRVYVYLRQ